MRGLWVRVRLPLANAAGGRRLARLLRGASRRVAPESLPAAAAVRAVSKGIASAYVTVRYRLDVCVPENLDDVTLDALVRGLIDNEGGAECVGGLSSSAEVVSVERVDES